MLILKPARLEGLARGIQVSQAKFRMRSYPTIVSIILVNTRSRLEYSLTSEIRLHYLAAEVDAFAQRLGKLYSIHS